MGKYRKILVAFDGSLSGKNALKQAIALAQAEKSWIKVLSVLPSYEGDLDLVAVGNVKSVIEGPREQLVAEAKSIAESEGATIITNVEQGEAYERIVDVADNENCDIIVMGRRGLKRIERMLMGSTTSRVIGHTRKVVLVIPRGTSIGWGKILLATDGSAHSLAAAEHAINFAISYGSDLTAVSVVDITDEFYAQAPQAVDRMIEKSQTILENVRKKAEGQNIKTETVVREGEPYEKIIELAAEKKSDVIFIGSHGKAGIKKLLMGSVTEKVIGHTPCPVMIVTS